MTKGIYLRNLPTGITSDELSSELRRIFRNQEELLGSFDRGEVQVRVFKPNGRKQSAVVIGLSANFDEMKRIASKDKIGGRDVLIYKDRGDDRDEFGEFLVKLAPSTVRSLESLQGHTHRRIAGVFNSTFWNACNPIVAGIKGNPLLKINSARVNDAELNSPGECYSVQKDVDNNVTTCRYQTLLERIQALRVLNGSLDELSRPIRLSNSEGTEACQLNDCTGLGKENSMINIPDACIPGTQFVSLSLFDEVILNSDQFPAELTCTCWRCKKPFEIKTVQFNLEFVGAKCECKYDRRRPILDEERAFFWPGESFTRLFLGPRRADGNKLVIAHAPIKEKYQDKLQYQEIVLPLLQEEFKWTSRQYKESYSCSGLLDDYDFIETLKEADGNGLDSLDPKKWKNVFVLQTVIEKTRFWKLTNQSNISKVTIQIGTRVTKYGTEKDDRVEKKGKVRGMQEETPKSLRLFVEVELECEALPQVGSEVEIVPKPKKTEYQSVKQAINKWVRSKENDTWHFLLFLGKLGTSWKFDPSLKKPAWIPMHSAKSRVGLSEILQGLNAEQMQGFNQAMQNIFSVIHGPPGTGKTYLLSTIIAAIATLEAGQVLVVAPSNTAADNIAEAVAERCCRIGNKKKILRVFALSRENSYMARNSYHGYKDSVNKDYVVLHEEVWKSSSWEEDDVVSDGIKILANGEEYTLTKSQRTVLEAHARQLEVEIVKKFDVIVCTVGALADKRMENINKVSPFSFGVLDEAGQLRAPETISLLALKLKRLVIAGDHLQLKSQVNSYSAEVAGLSNSMIGLLSLFQNDSTVPWTMLKEQHRMEKDIRQIISDTFYGGLLLDAPSIRTRPKALLRGLELVIPELKKSTVVVYNHSSPEIQDGFSWRNDGELDLVYEILETLVKNSGSCTQITVLTLYEAQKEGILRKIQCEGLDRNLDDIEVVNVDGYQGKENEIIVLSVVRSNDDSELGFTAIPNRLNVALSRARSALFVCCNYSTLKAFNNQTMRKLTKSLDTHAAFKNF